VRSFSPLEDAQAEVLSADPSNEPIARFYFDKVRKRLRLKLASGWISFAHTADGLGLAERSGEVALVNGADSGSVTFNSDIGTTKYTPTLSFFNDTDPDPFFLLYRITVKTTTGFSFVLNTEVDTGNYTANYTAVAHD